MIYQVRLYRARASPGRVDVMDVVVARGHLHRGPDDIRVNHGVKLEKGMSDGKMADVGLVDFGWL